MMSADKDEALAGLRTLVETCKSALTVFTVLTRSVSSTQAAPILVLRNDMLSLHRLINTSATRLSIALGKPPPSYHIALVPITDLTTHAAQLSSCVTSLPPGALRKEAVWAAEELLRALLTLGQHFETRCRQDGKAGEEYLAKTGAVHNAAAKAENMSSDETEAVAKAWRRNGENLDDSLKEVKEITEADNVLENDGWDELGEGFGGELEPEEIERVKQIYPLLRFTTLLHGRILSHHILKPPASGIHPGEHLTRLLQLSDSLLPATDNLASGLYPPQDSESIQEAAEVVHRITRDFASELAFETNPDEAARQALEQLQVDDSAKGSTKTRKWFQQCFRQIDIIYNGLNLKKPA